MFHLFTRAITASYAPHNIATLVGNRNEDTAIVFVRADEPPEYTSTIKISKDNKRVAQDDSLMPAPSNQSGADRFAYACRNHLHLRQS